MLELSYGNQTILKFASAGNLKNSEGFLHRDRCLDTFVVLFCIEGVLYIAQNERKYALQPNQHLILFPGYRHFGYKRSESILSYYWCHFWVNDNSIIVSNTKSNHSTYDNTSGVSNRCVIPEYEEYLQADRISLHFRHLIDISRQSGVPTSLLDFSISLLMQEISYMYINKQQITNNELIKNSNVLTIIDYVQHHYGSDINVAKLADIFGYNHDYLSAMFKKFTNTSLLYFINKTRIDMAKEMLLNSSNSIKYIAAQVGFNDEKYFMKLFRKMVNKTPTQYRNVYFRKHINRS